MTDHPKSPRDTTSGKPAARNQAGHPAAAEPGKTVGQRDAADARKAAKAKPDASRPMAESSLVGKGGLAAMTKKSDADAPLRLQSPAEKPTASAVPKVASEAAGSSAASGSAAAKADSDGPKAAGTVAAPKPAAIGTTKTGTQNPAPRGSGFGGMVLGGLIAAGLGAGATYWAIPHLPPAWQPGPAATPPADSTAINAIVVEAVRVELGQTRAELQAEARRAAETAARTAATASLAAEGEGLLSEARLAGADAAAKLIAEAPATAQPDSAVQTTLAAQAQQLAALDEALQALRAAPAVGAPVDLSALEQQLAAQAAQIRDLAARPAADPAEAQRLAALAAEADAATRRVETAAAEAEAKLQEAEARSTELSAAADTAARRARAAAAAASLGEAIQTGAPRTEALAQLDAAGVQAPAALTADIPTPEQLAADYPAAARAAVRAALRAEAAQGQGSVIGNFLRAQTGARSVAPREGTDADAILSRAGDAVQRGRIDAALAELAALPDPARPAMSAWIAQAETYANAQAALAGLTGAGAVTSADGDAVPESPATDAAAPTAAPSSDAPAASDAAPAEPTAAAQNAPAAATTAPTTNPPAPTTAPAN